MFHAFMSGMDARQPRHALLRNLTPELFQTEVSASRHCRREARRNPNTPPALALLAVAEHADVALRDLTALAAKHELPRRSLGVVLGNLFSEGRERIADHLIDAERSYRGTLLGMRHGTDVVRMFGATARHAGNTELAEWAETWLERRDALVKEAELHLDWFALHAQRALARAH